MEQKRVLITGAASGMGLAAVRLFQERGWFVIGVDINQEQIATVEQTLQAENRQGIVFYQCDITDEQAVLSLQATIQIHHQGIDSLINNAGIWRGGKLHETTVSDWDLLLNVDVKSIFLLAKAFIPGMIAQGGGTIVNTASVSGMHGDYEMAAYNAAKGAVVNLVRAMALDYGKDNIRVNNVCPAACATPMFLQNSPEVIAMFHEANPLGRICTPEEVAKAMYFLASDESSATSGLNLTVSGGLEVHTGQPIQ